MTDIREMVGYLFKKLDSLNQACVSIEDDIQKEIDDSVKSGLPEGELNRIYHHLEYVVANLSRQAMLVMVCACLEEAMDFIGETTISDYQAKLNKKKGSWFKKRKRLFEESGASFDAVAEECGRVSNLVEVRNCIVHAGARVDRHKDKARLEEAVAQLKERDKDANVHLVEISADRFLYLGDNIVATAIIAAEEIIELCVEQLKMQDGL